MSLEKLYNYVCGVMQRSEVCIDGHDEFKMRELAPQSNTLKTDSSRRQYKEVCDVIEDLSTRPVREQAVELQIMSIRLAFIIETEEWPTCNKCGESVPETVSIAVGTDLYSCCRDCADKVCDYIMKV